MNAHRYARLFFQVIGGLALGFVVAELVGFWGFLLVPLAFNLVAGRRASLAERLTPVEVRRRNFIDALVWCDVGLCLAIFVLVPERSHYAWNSEAQRFINAHQWQLLVPLFLAVVFVTIGIYKAVDALCIQPASAARPVADSASSAK